MLLYLHRILLAPSFAMKLRFALLLPFPCRWNGWVRDLTAAIEQPGTSLLRNVLNLGHPA
jgi:hypothetical protein